MQFPGLNFGLGTLPMMTDAETRSISAENPDGAKGGGAKAAPGPDSPGRYLGKGWKIRPCITIPAGETAVLADVDGPGVIQHIWITTTWNTTRAPILRMYWDGEETPCVEAPMGDFFACGFSEVPKVNSLPVCVNPSVGLNCYWPMPFRRKARITLENPRDEDQQDVYYQITYALTDVPDEAAYLHAQYRQSRTTRECPEHVILDNVTGRGQYVGTYLAWEQSSNGWWGEGEVKFYIDGDGEHPTICGTGTEDYVGGAWCFGDTYSTPFCGYPYRDKQEGRVPRHAMYRWHVLDPIRFREDMRVTVQALGWLPLANRAYEPLCDKIASTAFWYQTLPHGEFPPLPPLHERWTR